MRLRRLVSVVAVMSAYCVSSLANAAPATGDPYPIDVILPITGGGAFIGAVHQKQLVALEGVVNRDGGIAGRPVKFVFHDDQTNPSVSLQLANEAIAKKPAVVLGSSLGALCNAMTPAFVANGPVNYCFSPVIRTVKGSYVFSGSVSGSDLILGTLRYFHGRGWKNIATLNTTDGSGQIADADIARNLALPEFKDMKLVAAEHFNPTDTSTTAQLSKIKALNPQAIILWAPGTPFGTALHGVQDVGLNIPVATTSANMVTKQIESYAAFMPKDVYFQGLAYIAGVPHRTETRQYQVFTTAIKEAGISQDFQGGMVWDPAMIVIDALRKIGPAATPEQLRNYLETVHGYQGITGTYDFRDGSQRGLGPENLLIMRWDPDKSDFVSVSKMGGAPL